MTITHMTAEGVNMPTEENFGARNWVTLIFILILGFVIGGAIGAVVGALIGNVPICTFGGAIGLAAMAGEQYMNRQLDGPR